jgi:hypothetical protein
MLVNAIIIYVLWCIAGYAVMEAMYDFGVEILPNVRRRWVYYLLQFTWGLPMNVAGLLVAGVMLLCGKRPYRYGWNYCFEVKGNAGLELGIFFIAPIGDSVSTKNHEVGHAIQNIYFGPFSIGMVSIPSVLRFWARRIQRLVGRPPKTDYDDIWFEGQASKSGNEFIATINKERK